MPPENVQEIERASSGRIVTKGAGEHVSVGGGRCCYCGQNVGQALATFDIKPPERFTRVNFTAREKDALLGLLKGLPRGAHGKPWGWKKDDGSWKAKRAECG